MSIIMASPVPQKEDVERWTVEQVAAWLKQMELADCCEAFLKRGIDGHSLMELTEESLLLWGRDVSIRNCKKIWMLIKQIEYQYLQGSGKPQQSELPKPLQDLYRQSEEFNNFDHDYSDDEDNDSDFDDIIEIESGVAQHDDGNSYQTGYITDSSSGEGIYLNPSPAPANRPPQIPPKASTYLPVSGSVGRPGAVEKRPPMPLPFNNGTSQGTVVSNSSQKFGSHLGGTKLTPSPGLTLLPKKNQQRSGSTIEPPRRPPPVSGFSFTVSSNNLHKPYPGTGNATASKPVTLQRERPSKKSSEPPTPNSQSDVSSEGGGIGGRMTFGSVINKRLNFSSDLRPTLPSKYPGEDADDHYEVMENPQEPFMGNEVQGSPPGLSSPNQAPPLPQRNQDGRDNKTSVPNQQQSTGSRLPTSASAASSVSLNRQTTALSSSLSAIANKRALHSTKSNSPDRLQKPGSLNRLPTAQPQPLLPPTSRPPPPLPPVPHSLSHPSQPNPNIPPPDRAPPVPPTSRPPPPLPPVPHSLSHPSQPNPNIPPPDRAPPVPPLLGSLQNIGGGPPHGEIVRLGEGESVTLTPLYCALMDKPYFHLISRNKSKHLLEEAVEDGVFLIRPSTRSKDPLTLSLCYSRRIYNIVIRQRRDGLFALGSEKMNEVSFGTIDEVVSTHTSEPLKLQSGNRVTLTTSPPKTGHIYVTLPNTIEEKH